MIKLPLPRRLLQFRVRALLALMLLVAVPLAWMCRGLAQQRAAVAAVSKARGSVAYDYQTNVIRKCLYDPPVPDPQPPGPRWLRACLGDDVLANIEQVYLNGPAVTVNGELRSSGQVDPDEAVALVARLGSVKFLSISSASDRTLAHLAHSKSLTHLILEGDFTDDGLRQLRGLNLESLDLTSENITREGLLSLRDCPKLTRLVVAAMPGDDEQALKEAMPNCQVVFVFNMLR